MESRSNKSEIIDTFSNVRYFSFEEKKAPLLDTEGVNRLLDAIIDFKSVLNEKTH
ncbi:hypothetical protein QYS49_38170 [Marivirga salinae]|uniref:Uncharacterized protein n=1 Tax=Marivirga salinarum TaxID=3059078 RepID=A0AA51NA54_9BACT|nr:hypothetical protein [Marivirga sp. BDSF4-3]WMN11378.1 hypothetical protein QYS49_38170 [Marivirga sp. BDSF4-3]